MNVALRKDAVVLQVSETRTSNIICRGAGRIPHAKTFPAEDVKDILMKHLGEHVTD